jgi:uncharacterized protein (DUF1778 family)
MAKNHGEALVDLRFRLTKDQRALIEAAAKEAGLNLSAAVRAAALAWAKGQA